MKSIVDDFPAIKAAMERNKPAEPKHPLLLEAVIAHQQEQLAEKWKVSPDGTEWRWVAATDTAGLVWRPLYKKTPAG